MTESETEPKKTVSDFMKKVYSRRFQSVWTATLGQNQSGKTDFNLRQMETLHKLGLADGFGSNIPDLDTSNLKEPFDIDFIEDFETLRKRCQMLNPDPEKQGIKRYFFLGDEMGNWAPQDQPWLNVKFIRELQQVRKYGLCFLGTAIDRVDSRILNESHFHGVFHKISKANPTIAVYVDWFRRGQVQLKNITRTKIKFNTWHSATFYMEPQTPQDIMVPLNPEHEIAIKYLDNGETWRGTGIHRQTGKIALGKVLRFHMRTCVNTLMEQDSKTQPEQEERTSLEEGTTAS